MPRTFAYLRICLTDQTAEAQSRQSKPLGSASVPLRRLRNRVRQCRQHPGFIALLNKLKQDDVLVVTKLDRLGRHAMDLATSPDRRHAAPGAAASFALEISTRGLSRATQSVVHERLTLCAAYRRSSIASINIARTADTNVFLSALVRLLNGHRLNYFLRGSSAGLTKAIPPGPMYWTWMTAGSSPVQTVWA